MNAKSFAMMVVIFQCATTLACYAQDADHRPLSSHESATLIMSLQRNKDLCESFVLLAKSDKVHKRDMIVGMKLYSDAMREYNSLILFLSTAVGLGEDFAFLESEITLLNNANEKASAFCDWYTEPLMPKKQFQDGDGLHGSPAIAGALAEIGVEIAKAVINHFAQEQIDKNRMIEQRRAVIREGLSGAVNSQTQRGLMPWKTSCGVK